MTPAASSRLLIHSATHTPGPPPAASDAPQLDTLTPLPLPKQIRIVREDGVAGLFRGGAPTVVRAMALNMGMLASNDQVCCVLSGYAAPAGQHAALHTKLLLASFDEFCCLLTHHAAPDVLLLLLSHQSGQGDD
jgi:hypothetical protein